MKYLLIIAMLIMFTGCKDDITIAEVKTALKDGNMVRCSGMFTMEDFNAGDNIFFEDGVLSKQGILNTYDLSLCRIVESI